MPILLTKELPIKSSIKDHVHFISEINPDLPYVNIGILNLMSTLEDTERNLIEVLDTKFLQVKLDFIYLKTKKTKQDYYQKYYLPFSEIKNKDYDGLIITGAPLAFVPLEEISYLEELKKVLDYTKDHVRSTIFLCWSASFTLNYFYQIPKKVKQIKSSGIYPHKICQKTALTKGLDDIFYIPISRYITLNKENILEHKQLILTSISQATGVFIVESIDKKQVFLTGHAEYDRYTLDKEYQRDRKKGLNIKPPLNYYQNNKPICSWCSSARILYHNWLYEYVYQDRK